MKTNHTLIANPLYDVVFRYMMEDNKVAKLFLSAIIDEEIVELEFRPTEYSQRFEEHSITVTRMDFSAKILQEDGSHRLILIELQKSKYFFQIMRFRSYLGKQYQNPDNFYTLEEREKKFGLPIYPIYILGEAFTAEKIPVIRVKRNYIDAATNEKILEKHPFIEALTHDATVIQVSHLKESRRTVLEQFLEIFDQTKKAEGTNHFLQIDEDNYPKKYHEVIRRLRKAMATPQIEGQMELEDDVIEAFHDYEKKMLEKNEELKQAEAEREKEKKARLIAEHAQHEAEVAKKKAEHANIKTIKNLSKSGFSIEKINEITGIDIDFIKRVLA